VSEQQLSNRLQQAMQAAAAHLKADSWSVNIERGLAGLTPLDDPHVPADSPIRSVITGVEIMIGDEQMWFASVESAIERLEEIALTAANR